MNLEQLETRLMEHFAGLFPKRCSTCKREYATLQDFLETTVPVGHAHSYDAEIGNWDMENPLGILVLFNCDCGSTIAINTDDIDLHTRRKMLKWLQEAAEQSGQTPARVLSALQEKLTQRIREISGR